ncbi:MAG: hypothetical protein SRB2_01906 [Desulfobacteraceae bacterium Eth-SRB2]|nr:MAG: hypothetical protein SRB2_01906 [Desulfobacteraceae bacterium Eth-SRB2]
MTSKYLTSTSGGVAGGFSDDRPYPYMAVLLPVRHPVYHSHQVVTPPINALRCLVSTTIPWGV